MYMYVQHLFSYTFRKMLWLIVCKHRINTIDLIVDSDVSLDRDVHGNYRHVF